MNYTHLDHLTAADLSSAVVRSDRWIDDTEEGRSRPLNAAVAVSDLGQSAALLDAATRMHDGGDPETAPDIIAAEALQFVPADGVVVLSYGKSGPPNIRSVRSRTGDLVDADRTATLCLGLSAAGLLKQGQVSEIALRRAQLEPSAEQPQPTAAMWRSALVADLGSPTASRPTRLLWYSTTAAAFATSGDVAVLFARHAGLALRTVNERYHLRQALEGRTITGQATGILMNRYRLTAAQAFEILHRCSQDRNIKLRDVADTLNHTGELPG